MKIAVLTTSSPLTSRRGARRVDNLLSKGIITLDHNLERHSGPPFRIRRSSFPQVLRAATLFCLNPPKSEFPGNILPSPLVGGPTAPAVAYIPNVCAAGTTESQCAASLTLAQESENGLSPEYYPSLLVGGSGLPGRTPDTRITNVNSLPAGPFQLTNGSSFVYTDYAASPVHRFYQMVATVELQRWSMPTGTNPSGCDSKLFAWVEVTVGAGTNGTTQAPLCSSDSDALPCFTTELPAQRSRSIAHRRRLHGSGFL